MILTNFLRLGIIFRLQLTPKYEFTVWVCFVVVNSFKCLLLESKLKSQVPGAITSPKMSPGSLQTLVLRCLTSLECNVPHN